MREGARAPDFRLPDQDGTLRSLGDFKARCVVLFFYPKDNTPGCSIEAKSLSEARAALARFRALPVGVSGGTLAGKRRFCEKLDLAVPMLTDEDFAVARAYGVYGPKKFMGRSFLGIVRTTFVLDDRRRVLKIFSKVKPAEHAAELLAFFESLGPVSRRSSSASARKRAPAPRR